MLCFTPDGGLDPTFGSGGIVVTTHDAFNMAGGVAVQSDGKLLLAAGSPYAVLRHTHDGKPDSSLGSAKPLRSTRLPKGAVVAQKPAAGREAPDWATVALSVSRGKK